MMGKPKAKIRWLLAAGLLAGVGLAVAYLLGVFPPAQAHTAKQQAGKEKPPPVTVTVAPVTARPVQRQVQVVGTLNGFEEVTVTPKIEGIVTKICHEKGSAVRPGDVLLEIEETYYALAVKEAERALELELARIALKEIPKGELVVDQIPTVAKARSEMAFALEKLNRARSLAMKNAVGAEDLDAAQKEYAVATANKDHAALEARATLAAARYKFALLETARQRLTETRVVAPMPSKERLLPLKAVLPAELQAEFTAKNIWYTVAKRHVSEGEMVRAFPSVAVFRLVIDNHLKLSALVPERHLGEIKAGQAAEVAVEAHPGKTFIGSVVLISPTVDTTSRTFEVEILVPNLSRQLNAGSFARAAIRTRLEPKAATVPQEAVVSFAGVNKVFVIEGGVAKAIPVQLGVRLEVAAGGRIETWYEVQGDVRADQFVATSGQSKLVDGSEIKMRDAGR